MDEFQNFATESFESILSEARKYRLNLFLANQFMTQLTDKIREGILGNCGTIMSGRLGVTDAELMEKAFSPVFNAEDLHKQGNFQAIATVMMYNVPSAPFTMKLLPPMGESNAQLLESMKTYTATKYGRTRAEVEREIKERWKTAEKTQSAINAPEKAAGGESTVKQPVAEATKVANSPQRSAGGFLEAWKKKREQISSAPTELAPVSSEEPVAPDTEVKEEAGKEATQEVAEAADAEEPKEAVFKVR